MDSKVWGKQSWDALFFIACGYDLNDAKNKKEVYTRHLKSWGDVLPCRYCRDSYRGFFLQLNIEKYLDNGPCGLIKFVYDLKNLVNAKLIEQEETVFKKRFQLLLLKKMSEEEYYTELRKLCQDVFYTKPAPSLQEVTDYYLQFQAGCSSELKTCRSSFVGARNPKTQVGGSEEMSCPDLEGQMNLLLEEDLNEHELLDHIVALVKRAYCPYTSK